jgi:putative ABC transport system substrate-binding protein
MLRKILPALAALVLQHAWVAQSAAAPASRIGLLSVSLDGQLRSALLEGLREQGYRDVALLDRSNVGAYQGLAAAAKELVQEKVAVIIAFGTRAPAAAYEATRTIPIVIVGGDPVDLGMAKSYSRPGGNVTGVIGRSLDLYEKHLELLTELVPKLKRVAVIFNPDSPAEAKAIDIARRAAQRRNVELFAVEARGVGDFDAGLAAASKAKAEALWIIPSTTFTPHAQKLAALALQYKMPSITFQTEYSRPGVLLVYGPNLAAMFRRAGGYAARLLKGQAAAQLPIDQPTEFELLLNENTAKALGMKIPETIRFRASPVR